MSPLLQAAQAHFVEEEMRQLAAPKTEHEPETSPPPSLPEFIALPDESVVPSESVALESTFPSAPRTASPDWQSGVGSELFPGIIGFPAGKTHCG